MHSINGGIKNYVTNSSRKHKGKPGRRSEDHILKWNSNIHKMDLSGSGNGQVVSHWKGVNGY
jgi:hypothetical protein